MREHFNEHYLKTIRPDHPKVQFEMKIVTDPNQTPFYFKSCRFSYTQRKVINDVIVDMLNQNIIRKSKSPYSSPIILTKKKTGELRLCIDFRCINKIKLKDNFSLPIIEDLIDRLRDNNYFTILDLKSAFHHVNIDRDSIKYTSFIT